VHGTAAPHHPTLLEESYQALNRTAAVGVDGVTWREYGEGLADRLSELHRKVHTAADASNQADAAANWRTTLRGGAVVINWSVGADGLISGASSTGCSYAGNLAAQPEIRVFKVSFKESCPNLAARDLSGIATVKSDLSTLKVLATTANDAQGAALLFAKLPTQHWICGLVDQCASGCAIKRIMRNTSQPVDSVWCAARTILFLCRDLRQGADYFANPTYR
jgi:hypothetical protein